MDSSDRGYEIPSQKKYGVFLSFRGPDVRTTFVDHLYEFLTDKGINVYLDELSMEKGEFIDNALKRAIEDSTISIPIFSRNYASSPHCLQELTHMCKSGAVIKPLFYDVKPHHVRYAESQPSPAGESTANGEARAVVERQAKAEGDSKENICMKEARTEDQKDARGDRGSEIRTEGESEARTEGECEAITESGSDVRTEGASEERVEGKCEARAKGESEGKIEGRTEARAEGGSEIRTKGKNEASAESNGVATAEDQRDARAKGKGVAIAEDKGVAKDQTQRDARAKGKGVAIVEDQRDARARGKGVAIAKGKGVATAEESETNPYSEALKEHCRKGRYKRSEIDEWRESLNNVSDLNGWTLESKYGYEGKFVKLVVSDVIKELDKFPYQNLPKHTVQLDERIADVIRLLEIDNKEDVLKIGIWGLDGIGKTAIAKAVFNRILQDFEACCFLSDVSTKWQKEGIKVLQEQQMRDLLSRKDCRFSAPESSSVAAQGSALKRILIVLDDVVDFEPLEILLGGKWAGSGSRIIVTTPDKHVLNMAKIDTIYKMEGLKDDEALRLFCWHAFVSPEPDMQFVQQCKRIVEACAGLPLALQVAGDELCDKTDKPECWHEAMSTPQSICHQKIYSVLRPSYEKLTFQERKIYLHIARFYIGKETEHGIRYWKMLNWDPHTAVKNLELKSFISIGDDDKFMMHRLLIDMAKAEETRSCYLQILSSISKFTSISNFHIKSLSYKRSEKKGCTTQSENRQSFSPGDITNVIFIEGAEKFEMQDFRGASELLSASVFGTSYKVPLSDNRVVVVKELIVDVSSKEDFEKVMELSAKLKHGNVASIEAYYYSPELKFVVQKYFHNGSLHHLLHGSNEKPCPSWKTCRRIALGIAKGLCFIHSHANHAHGNVKSSNILLDENNEAFVSDFIPYMLSTQNTTSWKTKGYNHHEHIKGIKMTKESDVFAYGVLLLEILTRKDPWQLQCQENFSSLSQWTQDILSISEIYQFMYSMPMMSWNHYVKIHNMFAIADHCVSQCLPQRPTMEKVLQMLASDETISFLSDNLYRSYLKNMK
ncbi:uncharacterized protein LOC131029053 [Cryptomeria japonica]|uniref:uncharacterized protein LOC131029053 n=1 Tax=Cryptomeria japonica TaxID=3369 RepID=UPI0027DA8DCE|nr:uncharacterized protein LOC131029053 [Cryptomeria japonica]